MSCKSNKKSFVDFTVDNISAGNLWDRITEESNYRKYPMWPEHKGLQPGQSPHGRFHKVFINHKLRNALPIADKTAPNGSMIIKENYDANKELVMYTAMVKVKGYNPDNGDWFWVKYDKDGNSLADGKVQKCADCHIGNNNDYVILRKLDKPLK
jgi:hypothetical protein